MELGCSPGSPGSSALESPGERSGDLKLPVFCISSGLLFKRCCDPPSDPTSSKNHFAAQLLCIGCLSESESVLLSGTLLRIRGYSLLSPAEHSRAAKYNLKADWSGPDRVGILENGSLTWTHNRTQTRHARQNAGEVKYPRCTAPLQRVQRRDRRGRRRPSFSCTSAGTHGAAQSPCSAARALGSTTK